MKIGYARTSTSEQKAGLESQERDLKNEGCDLIFSEQASGVSTERPELAAALNHMRAGDVLIVTKPDRLARSTSDLLKHVDAIRAKGCHLIVLSMGGQTLDTGNSTSKLMLTMLAAVAEFERDLMKERQAEGIAKAKAEGKYTGRQPTARNKTEDVLRLAQEGKGATEIARTLGIARNSVYRCLGKAF
ncbi:MAG: recombinase family protein [Acetobacter sp.]